MQTPIASTFQVFSPKSGMISTVRRIHIASLQKDQIGALIRDARLLINLSHVNILRYTRMAEEEDYIYMFSK